MLSSVVQMHFHTCRVQPPFQELLPYTGPLSTNLEVFFQHLHYVPVVQNALSHVQTGFLELFRSQLQREPNAGFQTQCADPELPGGQPPTEKEPTSFFTVASPQMSHSDKERKEALERDWHQGSVEIKAPAHHCLPGAVCTDRQA